MSSIWSSQAAGVLLATAMAVSGTVILLSLFRDNKSTFSHDTPRNQDSTAAKPPRSRLRSCLSSGTKDGRSKKRVRFAEGVKDSNGNGEAYRKEWRESVTLSMKKHVCCGLDGMDLSDGLLKNSVQLLEMSH